MRCNQTVKFRDLLDTARDLGAAGSWPRATMSAVSGGANGGPELHRGAEAARDQSYFLFATTRDQLD